jgi:hypothetical protein
MVKKARTGRNRYGKEHVALKRQLMYDLRRNPGQPCARCAQPMWPDNQEIHLDHSDDGIGYLGLAHQVCNARAGQVKTTAILRARRGLPPAEPRWGSASSRDGSPVLPAARW